MTSKSAPPDIKRVVVNYADLKKMGIPFCKEHIRRLELSGRFPQRVNLSTATVTWRIADIEAWLASRPMGVRK